MTLKQFYKLPDIEAAQIFLTKDQLRTYKVKRLLFLAVGFIGFAAFFSIGYRNINYFLYFPIFIILSVAISISLRYNTYINQCVRLTSFIMRDYVQENLKEVVIQSFTFNNIEYFYFKRKPSLDDIDSSTAQNLLVSSLVETSNIMRFKVVMFKKQIPEKYVMFKNRPSSFFVVENMIYSKSANSIFII